MYWLSEDAFNLTRGRGLPSREILFSTLLRVWALFAAHLNLCIFEALIIVLTVKILLAITNKITSARNSSFNFLYQSHPKLKQWLMLVIKNM